MQRWVSQLLLRLPPSRTPLKHYLKRSVLKPSLPPMTTKPPCPPYSASTTLDVTTWKSACSGSSPVPRIALTQGGGTARRCAGRQAAQGAGDESVCAKPTWQESSLSRFLNPLIALICYVLVVPTGCAKSAWETTWMSKRSSHPSINSPASGACSYTVVCRRPGSYRPGCIA